MAISVPGGVWHWVVICLLKPQPVDRDWIESYVLELETSAHVYFFIVCFVWLALEEFGLFTLFGIELLASRLKALSQPLCKLILLGLQLVVITAHHYDLPLWRDHYSSNGGSDSTLPFCGATDDELLARAFLMVCLLALVELMEVQESHEFHMDNETRLTVKGKAGAVNVVQNFKKFVEISVLCMASMAVVIANCLASVCFQVWTRILPIKAFGTVLLALHKNKLPVAMNHGMILELFMTFFFAMAIERSPDHCGVLQSTAQLVWVWVLVGQQKMTSIATTIMASLYGLQVLVCQKMTNIATNIMASLHGLQVLICQWYVNPLLSHFSAILLVCVTFALFTFVSTPIYSCWWQPKIRFHWPSSNVSISGSKSVPTTHLPISLHCYDSLQPIKDFTRFSDKASAQKTEEFVNVATQKKKDDEESTKAAARKKEDEGEKEFAKVAAQKMKDDEECVKVATQKMKKDAEEFDTVAVQVKTTWSSSLDR